MCCTAAGEGRVGNSWQLKTRVRKGVLASHGRSACFHITFLPQNIVMAFPVWQVLIPPALLAHASKTQCSGFAAVGNSVKLAFFT